MQPGEAAVMRAGLLRAAGVTIVLESCVTSLLSARHARHKAALGWPAANKAEATGLGGTAAAMHVVGSTTRMLAIAVHAGCCIPAVHGCVAV